MSCNGDKEQAAKITTVAQPARKNDNDDDSSNDENDAAAAPELSSTNHRVAATTIPNTAFAAATDGGGSTSTFDIAPSTITCCSTNSTSIIDNNITATNSISVNNISSSDSSACRDDLSPGQNAAIGSRVVVDENKIGDDHDDIIAPSYKTCNGGCEDTRQTRIRDTSTKNNNHCIVVNNMWSAKIRAMILQARDGGLFIFQRIFEGDFRHNDASTNKVLEDKVDGEKEGTLGNGERPISSADTSFNHDRFLVELDASNATNAVPEEETKTSCLDGVTPALATIVIPQSPPDGNNDEMSVNSTTSTRSWSVFWPRPGAYFVRYRQQQLDSRHQRLDNGHNSNASQNASNNSNGRFAPVMEISNFPFAVPILDDQEDFHGVVRVQGVAYDENRAAQRKERLRTRLYLVSFTLFSVALLALGFAVILVLVFTKKTPEILPPTRPIPEYGMPKRPPAPVPTVSPYHEVTQIGPYLDRFGRAIQNDLVNVNGSAYRLAANWIFYGDPLQLPMNSDHLIQRYLMALFYLQMSDNGKSAWRACNPPRRGDFDSCKAVRVANKPVLHDDEVLIVTDDDVVGLQGYYRWMSGQHECNWMGVSCNSENVVWGLHLSNQNLTGSLPTEVAFLSSLQSLVLSHNYITGTIPDAYLSLQDLVEVNLEDNLLSGTLSELWYEANDLRTLNVGNNMLSGTLSTSLSSLYSLSELQLNSNQLTGAIPTEIGTLRNLTTLSLNGNSFSGTIGSHLGQLTCLKHFSLYGNYIVGSIPSEIGLLTSLTDLRLGRNTIDGPIPDELYNLTNLQVELDLQNMMLNGTLSTKIGLLTSLQKLLLGENFLEGSVPSQLAKLRFLEQASFGLNLLTGPIPDQLCRRSVDLQADCSPYEAPFQECACCTSCCDRLSGNCSLNENVNL